MKDKYHILLGGREAVIEIPGEAPCQVSGKNVDGVVVTLWRERL